jgi:hypothetical protein
MAALATAGVPLAARPWYRRHVASYIAAHTDRRLAGHDAATVSAWLDAAARDARRPDWQIQQLAEAL